MVKSGRYGPYVSHDGVNATLPSDLTPETITLEQAIGLLEARARAAAARSAAAAKPRSAARKATPKAAGKPKPPTRPTKEPPRKSRDQ